MRLATITGSLALLIACGSGGDAEVIGQDPPLGEQGFTVSFSGTGYTPHDGQDYEVALVDTRGVVDTISRTHGGDLLEFEFTDVEPETYEVHLYFDVDSGGGCDANDHMWLFDAGFVDQDVDVSEDHSTNFTDVCSSF